MIVEIARWITLIAGAGFGVAAILALYRLTMGPSILDRMIASDVLVTTLMLVVGAEMVINKHSNTVGLMILLAATSVLATILVAIYVKRRRHVEPAEEDTDHAG